MPYFKVGDIVTLRKDLTPGADYRAEGGLYTITMPCDSVHNYRGKRVRITSIEHGGFLNQDTGEWYAYKVCIRKNVLWTFEMFEEGKGVTDVIL